MDVRTSGTERGDAGRPVSFAEAARESNRSADTPESRGPSVLGDEAVIARIGVGLGGVLRLIETEARQVEVRPTQDSPARLLGDLLSRSEREASIRAERQEQQESARAEARARLESLRETPSADESKQAAVDRADDRGVSQPRAVSLGMEASAREVAAGGEPVVLRKATVEASGRGNRAERAIVAAENVAAAAVSARVFEVEERTASETVRAQILEASDRASEALGPSEPGRLVELLG